MTPNTAMAAEHATAVAVDHLAAGVGDQSGSRYLIIGPTSVAGDQRPNPNRGWSWPASQLE